MHVEQFSSVNNLAVKHVHLTVVQVLYVYLTIVYGKNDGAHVRSMPKRSLFWQYHKTHFMYRKKHHH